MPHPKYLLVSACFCLLTFASAAQGTKPARCSAQPPQPPTDASRAYAAGDATRAESLYKAQLATIGTYPAFAGLVAAQLQQNNLPEALTTAQHAASALPTSAEAQALVGDVYFRSGQIAEASEAYTRASELNPCSSRAQYGVGRLAVLTSHHAIAAQRLAYAHGLAPADPEIAEAYFEILPDAQRVIGLHALLNSHPELPPDDLARVASEVAILDAHKTCTPVESPTTASLTLAPLMFSGRYERNWGLNVRLNSATELLELDTSVSGIVLSPHDAERAGVHPLDATPVTPGTPYLGVADHIQIGKLTYRDCPVRVVPASALADSNSLIGTNFFRDRLIHIDYVAQAVTLNPYPDRPAGADQFVPEGEKDWSPIYLSRDRILVPTLINKQGPYLFLLDSGIEKTVVSPAVTHNVLLASTDATLSLYGVSGDFVKFIPRDGGGDVFITDITDPNGQRLHVTSPIKEPVYRFTHNEIGELSAISFDIAPASHAAGTEISGLMGFDLLHRYFLDINYRDGLARILFDQNRLYDTHMRDRTGTAGN